MDYSKVIALNSITKPDCARFYANGKRLIINDGRIIDIVEED